MSDSDAYIGIVLDEAFVLSLGDLCRACDVHADWLMELIEEGVLDPQGPDPAHWRFTGISLRRARTVRHLQRDLGINLAGAALVLELINERDALRERVAILHSDR